MSLKVKYRAAGRMPKVLKDKRDHVISVLKEMEVEGNFDFTSAEELDDILESVRRSENRKFEKGGIVNENPKPVMSEEAATTEPIVQTPPEDTPPQGQMFQFDYSGIQEDPIKRSYNEIPVNEHTGVDVPEPQITSSIEALLNEQRGENTEDAESNPQQEQPKYENPAMNDLSDPEKKFAAEQLVDAVLNGYEALHDVGKNFAKYNEKKLTELATSGEIDMDVTFPVGEGEVTFAEYAQIHNSTVDTVLDYDPKFNDKVRDPMIRIFKKKNWGISDEQYVVGAFIADAGAKTAQVVQLMQSNKMVVNALKDHKTRQDAEKAEKDEVIHPTSVEKTVEQH